MPTGPRVSWKTATHHWQIGADDQAKKAAEYLPLIVAWRNGAPVSLTDVGAVTDSVEDVRNAGLANGKPSVLVLLTRQPNANIIETVDRVRALLPQLQASMPAAIDMVVATDQTTTIRASLHDVERTLVISMALVILVVFLFLRNWRATLIPSVAVPVSLIGTFGVMYLLGYSLDNLSLMALTIATGFVVDDAIVVLENISRHLEQGMRPLQAALLGAREVGFTVLSMSVSLVAVFIPILLMGGIVGRLFREFAVTLSVAILVSLVVSLTTTPMMCARLLKHEPAPRHGRFYLAGERAFGWALDRYERSLGWALRHSRFMLLVLLATIGLNVYLYVIVPKGFFPQQDTGRIIGSIQADQAISFQAMRPKLAAFVDIIGKDPAVANVIGFTGGSQRNTGRMFIALKPLEQRKASADQVINRLRGKLAQVPGATLFLQAAQDIRAGGRASNAQYQYTLQGDNLAELMDWSPRLLQVLRGVPQLADVNTDQQDKGLQVTLTIDRDTASRLGVTPADDRCHAVRRLRPAPGFGHLYRAEPVPRGDGSGAAILAAAADAERHFHPQSIRRHGAAGGLLAFRADHHHAWRQSPGPVRRHHPVLQPGAERGLERSRQGHRRRRQPQRRAEQHPRQFPGHGPGVPVVAGQPALADPGGAGDDLHRARHAV